MLHSDNQASRPNHAHPDAINNTTRRRLVEALGELTLSNLTAQVRAEAFGQELDATRQDYELLAADINVLRAEVAEAKERSTIPDVSKLDFDILVLELKHRGYSVVAEPPTLEEASPVTKPPEEFMAEFRRAPGIGD